jgi:hypothetical protein
MEHSYDHYLAQRLDRIVRLVLLECKSVGSSFHRDLMLTLHYQSQVEENATDQYMAYYAYKTVSLLNLFRIIPALKSYHLDCMQTDQHE